MAALPFPFVAVPSLDFCLTTERPQDAAAIELRIQYQRMQADAFRHHEFHSELAVFHEQTIRYLEDRIRWLASRSAA